MYLLDTNVISELRKQKPHGAVRAWFAGVDDAQLHLSSVTIGEIQAGIEISRPQNPSKAEEIQAWLDQVIASHNILPMDGGTFKTWAKLMHGQSDAIYEDAMIAATAKVRGLTVVTRNVKDFNQLGVWVFNPFEFAG